MVTELLTYKDTAEADEEGYEADEQTADQRLKKVG